MPIVKKQVLAFPQWHYILYMIIPLIYKMVLGASNFSELKQSLEWLNDKALISTNHIPDFTI